MARTGFVGGLTLVRHLARMPPWVRVALAVVSVVLGAVIVVRPTTALDVLAVLLGGGMVMTGILEFGELDERSDPPRPSAPSGPRALAGIRRIPWSRVVPVGWIVLGAIVLAWPGLTVRALAVITGILLLAGGAASLGSAFLNGRGWDERIADAAFGGTGLVFGVLALGWPDITLLVVAVVFGAWLIMRGLGTLWGMLRRRRAERAAATDGPAPRRRRWARTVAALAAVSTAVVFAVATAPLREGSTVADDFYAAPRSIPDQPGRLIRFEPFTREVPADAEGWRILYTTTGEDGAIRVASGLVVVPAGGDPQAPWPVIDWNHGTTGFDQHCAPSLQARPFWSGGLYPVDRVLAQGWAIVATDYIGLGTEGPHPYLFGPASGRASLDAVRAARELEDANLGPSTVVWGHSQGGAAAIWTAGIAPDYAPDVWIRGVAAFAPASDPPALVDNVSNALGGAIFASYAFAAFSEIYPDITYSSYIRPGVAPIMRAMAQRCLTDRDIALSVVGMLGTTIDADLFSRDPSLGELGRRLRENIAPSVIGPPLFVGQGGADTIVPSPTQDRTIARACEAGQRVDYNRYAGYTHAQIMEKYSPMIDDVIAWTQHRFDGDYADLAEACRTTDVG